MALMYLNVGAFLIAIAMTIQILNTVHTVLRLSLYNVVIIRVH